MHGRSSAAVGIQTLCESGSARILHDLLETHEPKHSLSATSASYQSMGLEGALGGFPIDVEEALT